VGVGRSMALEYMDRTHKRIAISEFVVIYWGLAISFWWFGCITSCVDHFISFMILHSSSLYI
jgi:uncharacterized protein YggL (DUF469 family)